MTNPQIQAFLEDRNSETLFLTQEVSNTDTELSLHVYTRNQRNARQALIALKDAVDELLRDWSKHKKSPPASVDQQKVDCDHVSVTERLQIIRPSSTSH